MIVPVEPSISTAEGEVIFNWASDVPVTIIASPSFSGDVLRILALISTGLNNNRENEHKRIIAITLLNLTSITGNKGGKSVTG